MTAKHPAPEHVPDGDPKVRELEEEAQAHTDTFWDIVDEMGGEEDKDSVAKATLDPRGMKALDRVKELRDRMKVLRREGESPRAQFRRWVDKFVPEVLDGRIGRQFSDADQDHPRRHTEKVSRMAQATKDLDGQPESTELMRLAVEAALAFLGSLREGKVSLPDIPPPPTTP